MLCFCVEMIKVVKKNHIKHLTKWFSSTDPVEKAFTKSHIKCPTLDSRKQCYLSSYKSCSLFHCKKPPYLSSDITFTSCDVTNVCSQTNIFHSGENLWRNKRPNSRIMTLSSRCQFYDARRSIVCPGRLWRRLGACVT